MYQSPPRFQPSLRQWDCLTFAWVFALTPGLAVLAVIIMRHPYTGLASTAALLLATVGTSLQTYLELLRVGRRAVAKPDEREELVRKTQPAALVWGTMATASWVGLFAHLLD